MDISHLTIQELEDSIDKFNRAWWVEKNPLISDPEYDEYMRMLEQLDPDNKRLTEIHDDSIENLGQKVKHLTPMLSLDKRYSTQEIVEWCKKVSRTTDEMFNLQIKYDGISCNKSGNIYATRGDGIEGENISSKSCLMKIMSRLYCGSALNCKSDLRGEIIVTRSDFEINKSKILRGDGSQYKTARSMCSGILGRDDVDTSHGLVLTFLEFELTNFCRSVNELESFEWAELISAAKSSNYPADGLVVKLADVDYSNSLGFTSHHPKGQMAFKFGNPTGVTVLEDVIWSNGKNSISPVGIVKCVNIEGINNTHISLHNYKYILDNNLHIGDAIEIERCGEIIPQFKRIITPGLRLSNIQLDRCPSCESPVVYNEPEYKCTNPLCGGSLLSKLRDSVIRIGIERLGEPTIQKMIDIGVTTLKGIFDLTYSDIRNLPGLGDTSAENLYQEIDIIRKKPIEDWKLFASLNIHGVGVTLFKKIFELITPEELYTMHIAKLCELPQIGSERAYLIWTTILHQTEYINDLKSIFPSMIYSKKDPNMCCEITKTICFTGKDDNPRAYWIQMAAELGYTFGSSVTKDMTLLVTNDPTSTTGKMKNAIKFNIPVMTYDQFKELS